MEDQGDLVLMEKKNETTMYTYIYIYIYIRILFRVWGSGLMAWRIRGRSKNSKRKGKLLHSLSSV